MCMCVYTYIFMYICVNTYIFMYMSLFVINTINIEVLHLSYFTNFINQ